jgi:hypothetical protein
MDQVRIVSRIAPSVASEGGLGARTATKGERAEEHRKTWRIGVKFLRFLQLRRNGAVTSVSNLH